jgi:PQQ-dependent dehydrogenase (s-GDH family)
MSYHRLWFSIVVACACRSQSDQPAAGTEDSSNEGSASYRVITKDLESPFEIVVGPDGWLWITERVGKRVTRVNPESGERKVALTISDAFQSAGDGVLGMALHPDLMRGVARDFVFVAYTYNASGDTSLVRRARIRRYTYDSSSARLREPIDIISDLPASDDHNSGRIVIGSDGTLYYSIGDQGNHQLGNTCRHNRALDLPSAAELAARDWSKYAGKILRINPDGAVPADNPVINDVRSHIFSYGHRNVQGLVEANGGRLYAAEHGPKSDDEINLIEAGRNYGWPRVAGYKDDRAYVFADWPAQAGGCDPAKFSDFDIPSAVPQMPESTFRDSDFTPPLRTFYTVDNGYDFERRDCGAAPFICWPTVAPSGLAFAAAEGGGLLLMTSLKRGAVVRIGLSPDGRSVIGEPVELFKTINRYRDVAISKDLRHAYVITDNQGFTQDSRGLPTKELRSRGAILDFTIGTELDKR